MLEERRQQIQGRGCAAVGFLGSFENSFDAKGRVMLPAKYRKLLTSDGTDAKDVKPSIELVVTLSFDNELRVYTSEQFDTYLKGLFANEVNGESRFDETDADERRMRAIVNANSATATFDGTGRIIVPAKLRKLAQIDKEALVEGSGEYLAIWDPDRKERFLMGEDVGGVLNDLVAKRKQRLAAARQAQNSAMGA